VRATQLFRRERGLLRKPTELLPRRLHLISPAPSGCALPPFLYLPSSRQETAPATVEALQPAGQNRQRPNYKVHVGHGDAALADESPGNLRCLPSLEGGAGCASRRYCMREQQDTMLLCCSLLTLSTSSLARCRDEFRLLPELAGNPLADRILDCLEPEAPGRIL
jgi:hypothetical protein